MCQWCDYYKNNDRSGKTNCCPMCGSPYRESVFIPLRTSKSISEGFSDNYRRGRIQTREYTYERDD